MVHASSDRIIHYLWWMNAPLKTKLKFNFLSVNLHWSISFYPLTKNIHSPLNWCCLADGVALVSFSHLSVKLFRRVRAVFLISEESCYSRMFSVKCGATWDEKSVSELLTERDVFSRSARASSVQPQTPQRIDSLLLSSRSVLTGFVWRFLVHLRCNKWDINILPRPRLHFLRWFPGEGVWS